MVANQLTKVDKSPCGVWLTVAACMAFVVLLAALFQVVTGQLEQAALRQAQHNAAQAALAGCAASDSGAVRRQCVEQVNAGFLPYSTYPQIETDALAGAPAIASAPGFQQAALTHRDSSRMRHNAQLQPLRPT